MLSLRCKARLEIAVPVVLALKANNLLTAAKYAMGPLLRPCQSQEKRTEIQTVQRTSQLARILAKQMSSFASFSARRTRGGMRNRAKSGGWGGGGGGLVMVHRFADVTVF